MSIVDDFIVEVLAFLTDLDYCYLCKYSYKQINNRNGKRRTFCAKYGLPMHRVYKNCIDHFQGFNDKEVQEIKRQHKAGKCQLVINGAII